MVSRHACVAVAMLAVGCSAESAEHATRIEIGGAEVTCLDAVCIDEGVSQAVVNGVTVLHRPLAGEPISSTRVVFDGGAQYWSPRGAHAEALLTRMMSWWGSAQYPRTWDAELGRAGALFSASADLDRAEVSMHAPAANFDAAWRLLLSSIQHPPIGALRDSALAHAKATYVHEFEAVADDPHSAAQQAAFQLIARGHPYDMQAERLTEVQSVTVSDVTLAYRALLDTRRITVVSVGDVSTAELQRRVSEAALGIVGSNITPPAPLAPLAPGGLRAMVMQFPDAPAWSIAGAFAAPSPGAPDYAALDLGIAVLSQRLFETLRTKHALVYTASASLGAYRQNWGTLSLSTTSPKEAMQLVRDTIATLLRDGIDDSELADQRAEYLTRFYLAADSPLGLAAVLARWHSVTGKVHAIRDHLVQISTVQSSEIRAALERYLAGMCYAAVGPSSDFGEADLLSAPAAPTAP